MWVYDMTSDGSEESQPRAERARARERERRERAEKEQVCSRNLGRRADPRRLWPSAEILGIHTAYFSMYNKIADHTPALVENFSNQAIFL